MEDRDKMQMKACIGTAHDYLWDAYRLTREAYEYMPDKGLSELSGQILTDMIGLLEVERRLNNDEI